MMPQPTPTVVIVGRPNVGKSTLFNRIAGRRRSIVGDQPGITRDRIHSRAEHRGRAFEVIDTGGIVPDEREFLPAEILKQARRALVEAGHIIFLVDGRSEIAAPDRDLARMLLRLGRPVSVAVNKIDARAREGLAHDFYSLGISDVFPVSAEHGLGVDALLDHVTAGFSGQVAEESSPGIRVAIVGRPNVGKSTLLNALSGQERAIVSAVAGTTRDAVDERISVRGVDYVFVDTAGIRRKGKTRLMAEKLSVVMARKHMEMADVVLMVIDAGEGVLGLDATIAGYAHEAGRAVILCVNKWDLLARREAAGREPEPRGAARGPARSHRAPVGGKRAFERELREQLKFLDYAPVLFLAARTGEGVQPLFRLIREVYESASKRVPTGELNRFVAALQFEERKIYYLTQASVRPPTFVAFTDRAGPLHFSHQRYLVNQLRKRFGFRGTPVVLKTRAKAQQG